MGSDLDECWCRRSSRGCFGHQSRFDVPPPAVCLHGHFFPNALLALFLAGPTPACRGEHKLSRSVLLVNSIDFIDPIVMGYHWGMSFAPHPFTLRQLQYVTAVAQELSFRRAAARCGVSQPSLSTQLT